MKRSNYSRGRDAERMVVRHLKELGINAIRIPLSKGFYVISDGKVRVIRGDIAAWVNGGQPVAVEVKKIRGVKGNTPRLEAVLMRRLCNHTDVLVVVVLGNNRFLYYSYRKNGNGCIRRLTSKEFVDSVCDRSTNGNANDIFMIPI